MISIKPDPVPKLNPGTRDWALKLIAWLENISRPNPLDLKATFDIPILLNSTGVADAVPLTARLLLAGSHYARRVDLAAYTQARLIVRRNNVALPATTRFKIYYCPLASDPTDIGDCLPATVSNGGDLDISGTGMWHAGEWAKLVQGAKRDVYLLIVESGGDATSTNLFHVAVQCR